MRNWIEKGMFKTMISNLIIYWECAAWKRVKIVR
ncbi:unnamed protein product [Paramecium octaurelia]|uniref:Uncharacterized protein n=1 Tax=Paramecium octaurelia TaxID=43137 RepID=A0A8S1XGR2_PAROT|nr:unnamed protein product [Paramecium octaurelia]